MYQNYGYEKYINRPELRNTIKYIVKEGDSLYEIAKAYGVTVQEIILLNNLASTMIYPNQILFIPTRKKYDTSKMTLKSYLESLNYDISTFPSDILDLEIIGKVTNSTGTNIYEVLHSDTLDTIMSKTGLTPYQILVLNKNNWLKPGEKIIIK